MTHGRNWIAQVAGALSLAEIGAPTPDSVPERAQYRDEGCRLFAACLSCPLPVCAMEMPPKVAGTFLREQELMAILASGRSAAEAAAMLHVSRRSIFRAKRYVWHRHYGLPVPA